jgi:hypothetical protein
MQIQRDQIVAGRPALQVRSFLRRNRFKIFNLFAAENALGVGRRAATVFVVELMELGLVERAREFDFAWECAFVVANRGQAFANATAAKPIHRKTANRILERFMERIRAVNSSTEFAFRVENALLFGSMLTCVDRLGDVDVAVDLLPKTAEGPELEAFCDTRRRIAREHGRSFRSKFELEAWPKFEVLLQLKAKSGSLSLHELEQVSGMPNLSYRVLCGNAERIATLIRNGRAV